MNEHENQHKKVHKSWIQQQDQSDCGVACMASVIAYFGGSVALEQLREKSGTTQTGTTLLGLYQAASQFGLIAEPYEADIENLTEQSDPCILHIIKEQRLQHFVICYGYDGTNFLISDPAEGIKQYSSDELNTVWQSKALLLLKKSPNFVLADQQRIQRWRWLWNLAKQDTNILTVAVLIGLIIAVLGLALAIFTQRLIDDFLPEQQTIKLFTGLVLLSVLLLAKAVLTRIRMLFLVRQSKDFNNRMITSFFGALLRLPVTFFSNRKTGDLIARMNDTRRLQNTITYLLGDVIIDILIMFVSAAFILYHSIALGLFILASFPVFFFITWKYHRPILERQGEVMKAHALNESNYVDTIQGIEAIKENNKEPFFTEVTRIVYSIYQQSIFELGKTGIRFNFLVECTIVTFTSGILGWGSWLVLQGGLLLGAMIAVVQMSGQLLPSAARLALMNLQIQEARVAFDRMYEFTSLGSEHADSSNNEKTSNILSPEHRLAVDRLGDFKGELESVHLRDITFRFPGRNPLLQGVSFEVYRGEIIGILGESGGGKTTLMHLMNRFYKEESGSIIVNSTVEVTRIPLSEWRNQLATVPQQVKIFNGGLIQNITLDALITQEEIEKISTFCQTTGLHDLFLKFPQGYATILGEEGVNLSGGQRQIVGLARALYKRPKLLLLDEATSAMDRNTEKQIFEILEHQRENMAVIMVTHRIHTLRNTDRVYILEGGTIEASGTIQDLQAFDNMYSRVLKDIIP